MVHTHDRTARESFVPAIVRGWATTGVQHTLFHLTQRRVENMPAWRGPLIRFRPTATHSVLGHGAGP